MKSLRMTNVTDPEMLKDLEKKAGSAEATSQIVTEAVEIRKADYTEQKKWYYAEVILKKNLAIIHVFPNKAGLRDEMFCMKTREALVDSVVRNVQNLFFLAEWIEEMDSFCISFLKTPDALFISQKLIKEFYDGLYRRLV